MPWIQITTETDKSLTEPVEDAFLASGAVSVTLMDAEDTPVLEPEPGTTPIWPNTRLLALYPADTDTDAVLKTIRQVLRQSTVPEGLSFRTEILEDKDWEREWMKNFHPIRCGQRLWICPSWREPPEPDAVNLRLDPGLAFGTGTHPTTFLCLQWLDGLNVTGKSVIDYGCGSGILGIAALLLGARSVTGIDIDPQALVATKDNVRRNGLPEERMQVYLPEDAGSLAETECVADVVLANILAGPLIQLARTISGHVRPGGQIALSGIIEKQASEVMAAYTPWFQFAEPVVKDEWVMLHGVKKNTSEN